MCPLVGAEEGEETSAMSSVPYKNGKTRVTAGESYIELVKFTKDGPQIESVISYGASDNPNSPHFNDQMEIYSKFKTKNLFDLGSRGQSYASSCC